MLCLMSLEFVNHYIIYKCADLLEDEGCVASLNHFAEQGWCGTECEASCIAFYFASLFIDVFQEPQLTEVAKGECCREIVFLAF